MKTIMRASAFATILYMTSGMSAQVTEINSVRQFNNLLESNQNTLMVVDFFATWCPPCKKFHATFSQLSNTYKNGVIFVKIDVEQVPALSAEYDVSSMPTFVFIKNKKEVARVSGANKKAVEDAIKHNL